MRVRSQDLIPKTLDEFYGYPVTKMFHSLRAKTGVLNIDPVTTPPICTVLKKSLFRNRFITSHISLLCNCSLDGKGLYEWTSQLTKEQNVSNTEIWWKSLSTNEVWQFMTVCLLHLGTWKQISSWFWVYIECISVFCSHFSKTTSGSSNLYYNILFLAVPQLNAVKPLVSHITGAVLDRNSMIQLYIDLYIYIFKYLLIRFMKHSPP